MKLFEQNEILTGHVRAGLNGFFAMHSLTCGRFDQSSPILIQLWFAGAICLIQDKSNNQLMALMAEDELSQIHLWKTSTDDCDNLSDPTLAKWATKRRLSFWHAKSKYLYLHYIQAISNLYKCFFVFQDLPWAIDTIASYLRTWNCSSFSF